MFSYFNLNMISPLLVYREEIIDCMSDNLTKDYVWNDKWYLSFLPIFSLKAFCYCLFKSFDGTPYTFFVLDDIDSISNPLRWTITSSYTANKPTNSFWSTGSFLLTNKETSSIKSFANFYSYNDCPKTIFCYIFIK